MVNYVKFMRCTQKYFNELTTKDMDTLYFVSDPKSADNGFLYLGNRLISGMYKEEQESGYISINDIIDIIIKENLTDNDILLYNEGTKKWENHALQDLLTYSSMVGAKPKADGIAGLVPVPKAGDQNKFLMGDGTWQEVDTYDDELHEIVATLVGDDTDISARNIAEEVTIDLRRRVGTLETVINGASSHDGSEIGLRTQVARIENTIGTFQAVDPKYFDIGEAINYFDNSITELNDRLRWHGLKEKSQ